jgi:hypothetical protein
MMKKATGEEPKMWGSSLIGFGYVRLKTPATGREVDWFRVGLSAVKRHAAALEKWGNYKSGAGCIYINKLADVDLKVLKGMIAASLKMDYFGK